MGPEFAGIWLACDTPNAEAPEDCDKTFSSPSPLDLQREALYIDARGYGQYFFFAGDLSEARPSECNAAFRLVTERVDDPARGSHQRSRGYLFGSEIPFGMTLMAPIFLDEVVEVTEGPGSAPGTYIVGNEGSTYWYKRIPVPEDFVGPCDGTEPDFSW